MKEKRQDGNVCVGSHSVKRCYENRYKDDKLDALCRHSCNHILNSNSDWRPEREHKMVSVAGCLQIYKFVRNVRSSGFKLSKF